jgi:protein ImuA
MKLISCQNGRILTSLRSEESLTAQEKVISTGFPEIDAITPGSGLTTGAIHELLWTPDDGAPLHFAMHLARRNIDRGAIVFCDDRQEIYPPAIAAMNIPLDRVYLLRPQKREDVIWSIGECLGCKGVAATVATIDRLSRIEARRLQLAAERGGGVGLLLRPMIRTQAGAQAPQIYAAATRWVVAPARGERTIQRWEVKLIHGHGGRVGQTVILEHSRETNLMRTLEKLADRSLETRLATGA